MRAAVLRHVDEMPVDDSAFARTPDKLALQANVGMKAEGLRNIGRKYRRRRLFDDLDLLNRRIGVRQAICKFRLLSTGRVAIKSAPVGGSANCGNRAAAPTGTPGIPGSGFGIELPVKCLAAEAGGPRATRSASMLLVRPCGR